MTRTFGSDNAIAWVQVRLKGGLGNLLTTTSTYSVVIILAMIATVQLMESSPSTTYSYWMAGVMILQSAILLLLAPARIGGAIKFDLTSGVIESNRLMPIAPMQAVLGYILGSTAQAMCLFFANLLIGGFAAHQAGIGPAHWLGANVLILTFAVFFWMLIACTAFHQKNALGFLFAAPAVPMLGQSGVIGLVPGVMLLATPLIGRSVFDMSTTLGGLRDVYILSIAAQIVVGSLCFVAACRKYRRADVIGFTPILGLLLLATWAAVSCLGTTWWGDMKPRYMRTSWIMPSSQMLASLLIGMILALIPVWAAAEQTVRWVGRKVLDDRALTRRPVRDEFIVVLAMLILVPLGAGAQVLIKREAPDLFPLGLIAITILLHLLTMSYLRRMLRFYTARLNSILFILMSVLWIGPLLVDLIRREMMEIPIGPALTEISCISPAGTIIALMTGRESQVVAGMGVQFLLTVLGSFFYFRMNPLRRRTFSGSVLKEI